MIIALAFVPIADLNDAFEILSQEITEELQPIMDWLEDSYIGRPMAGNRRRRALFSPQMWNVYNRTLDAQGIVITNAKNKINFYLNVGENS